MRQVSAAKTSIHLGGEARFKITAFPNCEVGPFASIDIADGVSILADNPETLLRLAAVLSSTAHWLASIEGAESLLGDAPHLSAVIS